MPNGARGKKTNRGVVPKRWSSRMPRPEQMRVEKATIHPFAKDNLCCQSASHVAIPVRPTDGVNYNRECMRAQILKGIIVMNLSLIQLLAFIPDLPTVPTGTTAPDLARPLRRRGAAPPRAPGRGWSRPGSAPGIRTRFGRSDRPLEDAAQPSHGPWSITTTSPGLESVLGQPARRLNHGQRPRSISAIAASGTTAGRPSKLRMRRRPGIHWRFSIPMTVRSQRTNR